MTRTSILPENKSEWLAMRAQDITSTEISALFGLSPYKTSFELWHEKASGNFDEFEPNERMKWGTRLQDTVARGIAEDNGWTVRAKNVYQRVADLRIGSSFDFEIVSHENGPGLLEIKCVDFLAFRDNWSEEDGVIEAPAHIELQLQHQMLVSGRSWGVIAALVAGNEVKLVQRKADPEIHEQIMAAAQAFWDSIAANQAPAPDYARDAKVISRLHQAVSEGTVLDATQDTAIDELVAQYRNASAQIKVLEDAKDSAKAKLLERIGTSEKVIGAGWSISAGTVEAKEVAAFVRQSYRNFRITAKKSK